jgi:hypothetical protein
MQIDTEFKKNTNQVSGPRVGKSYRAMNAAAVRKKLFPGFQKQKCFCPKTSARLAKLWEWWGCPGFVIAQPQIGLDHSAT